MQSRKVRALQGDYKNKYMRVVKSLIEKKTMFNLMLILDPDDISIWYGFAFNIPSYEYKGKQENEFQVK